MLESVVNKLINRLINDEAEVVRGTAAAALDQIDLSKIPDKVLIKIVDWLVDRLVNDANEYIRARAAQALGRINLPRGFKEVPCKGD